VRRKRPKNGTNLYSPFGSLETYPMGRWEILNVNIDNWALNIAMDEGKYGRKEKIGGYVMEKFFMGGLGGGRFLRSNRLESGE
jgi:hypothetical protein